MSNETYTNWWIASKKQLEDVQLRDQLIVESQKKPLASRNLCNTLVGGLYANYARVVKDLTTCLDQYTQVQKRVTMKKLVDSAVIRLHELKEELVKCNMAEIYYIDGNLIELKLVPQEIEILDPAFVLERSIGIENKWIKIQKGERIYTVPDEEPPSAEVHEEEKEEEEKKEDKHKKRRESAGLRKKVLTPEDIERQKQAERVTNAVTLIQIHERTRQERLYYGDLNNRRKLRMKTVSGELKPDAPLEVQEAAALMIQKVARGFAERQYQKRREIDRRLLIGMTEPSWKSRAAFDEFEKNTEHRRAVRKQNLRDYDLANIYEKGRVLRVVVPGLMEDITDEIREWFYQFYKEAMDFDKFPTEELGGSILVVRGETMTPKEYLVEVEKRRLGKVDIGKDPKEEKKQQEAAKKAEAEKKKKEEDKKKKEADALKKLEAKGGFMWNFKPTAATEVFKEGCEEYKQIWEQRPDSDNPGMKPYMDMVTEEKYYEVQLQVRRRVDELMRLELQILLEALKIDRSRGIGKAPPKEKAAKGKKGKGKAKKSKDPTAHRSTEDLFQELVDNGIIHTYPKVRISEFKGDFSYCNWEKRVLDFDPPATLGDVRQAVVMNCILPLGVGESMNKPRSVLIAGHRQSGKHLLANAVFYETQCVLFDLSPPILAGKYEGGQGMKMLVHLITKMSKILQPSVIFIDGGEKPFYKKIPNEEQALNPKKIGKQLFKGIVKPITPDDKILVLAISKKPFDGSAAGLKKAYERVILIPRTDYSSLYMYWRELLMPYHGIDRNFSVSELARYTLTYPLPILKAAVKKIMTPSRIVQLKAKPFDAHEVVEALLDMPEPITDKEWAKFDRWFNSTLPQKKRTMYMKIAVINRENEAKQAEKAKKKK